MNLLRCGLQGPKALTMRRSTVHIGVVVLKSTASSYPAFDRYDVETVKPSYVVAVFK